MKSSSLIRISEKLKQDPFHCYVQKVITRMVKSSFNYCARWFGWCLIWWKYVLYILTLELRTHHKLDEITFFDIFTSFLIKDKKKAPKEGFSKWFKGVYQCLNGNIILQITPTISTSPLGIHSGFSTICNALLFLCPSTVLLFMAHSCSDHQEQNVLSHLEACENIAVVTLQWVPSR